MRSTSRFLGIAALALDLFLVQSGPASAWTYHPSNPWNPPARFDHAPTAPVSYKMVDPWEMLDLCGKNAWSCSFYPTGNRPCVMILPKESRVIDRNMIANLIRHEMGHCNGWGPHHER